MASDEKMPDETPIYKSSGRDTRLLAGDFVAQQVQVIEFLGSGGMSDVYKCDDVTLSRVVAVKTLKSGFSDDSLRRLQTEGRAIARLEHPNIVKLYGLRVGVNDTPILVMEFVDGISLAALLERDGALSVQRSLRIASQIAEGLKAAHREGIVHRDLKPANIMIVDAGSSAEQVKILDFGIAKIQGELSIRSTQTGDVFGTPQYMSPEQAMGKKCDATTDQYSLGCILFEMLCGHPPFQQNSVVALLIAHAQEQVPSLRKSMKQSPSDNLQKLVFTLLQKNETDRYQSMREVSEAIVEADTASSASPKKFIVVGGAVTCLAIVVAVALFFAPKEPKKSTVVTQFATQQAALLPQKSNDDEKVLANPGEYIKDGVLAVREDNLSDEGLKRLARNQPFYVVSVRNCNLITAAGVESLNPSKLNMLDLNATGVDDKLARSITRFSNLTELVVGDTSLTTVTCKEIAKLPRLLSLGLRHTQIDGRALGYLAKMKTLTNLDLGLSNVSGSLHLLKNSAIEDLSVTQVNLTAADINDGLCQMKHLRYLRLDNTEISNEQLQGLAKIKELDSISIKRCQNLNVQGILEFHKKLPRCLIAQDSGIDVEKLRPRYEDVAVTGPELLKNGDFEVGATPKSNLICVKNSEYIFGWTVWKNSIGLFHRSERAPGSGNYSIDLNAGSPGVILQFVPTTPGCKYLVRFKAARAPNRLELNSSNTQQFFVQADDQRIQYDVPNAGASSPNMKWNNYAWMFTARRGNTLFQFGSSLSNTDGPCIDTVSIQKVTSGKN